MATWLSLLGAGVLCGFLNAAASSGSAISLPLLLALGLPPAVANATNRLPVLVGFITAVWRFQSAGAIRWRFCLQLMPVFLVSAVVGANLATQLPMERIRLLVYLALGLALLKAPGWHKGLGAVGVALAPLWIVGHTELLATVDPAFPDFQIAQWVFTAWLVWLLTVGVAWLFARGDR
jgi:hypothetical protein